MSSGDLRRSLGEVVDANDSGLGIHDLEEDNGIHLNRHVVGGDDLLRRDLKRDHAQIDHPYAIDPERDDEEQPRPLQPDHATKPKDNPSLVLLRDPKAGQNDAHHDQRPKGQSQDPPILCCAHNTSQDRSPREPDRRAGAPAAVAHRLATFSMHNATVDVSCLA